MPERRVFSTTLERIETLTSSVRSFFLRLPPGQKLDFTPGQFISIHLNKEGKKIRKPYSIASSPTDPTLLEICIKRVEGGYVSNTFFSFSTGIIIPIDGPDGVFVLKKPVDTDLFFIGTGTGVAPLRSMILWLFQTGFSKEAFLIFGVRSENEILYEKEFRILEEHHPNFHFIPTISRPVHWKGERGYVQDKIESLIKTTENKSFFLCGLAPMVNAVREKLKSIGIQRNQIHYEKYV
ncbi:MAG: ferredoxin--NADP reductase [Nitrospiria bacterium]